MKLPQLSLRELFLLVTLVAMGLGWWLDHARLVSELNDLNIRRFIENQSFRLAKRSAP